MEPARRYLAALLAGDEPAASAVVHDALAAGQTWASVAVEVVQPALRDVGQMWTLGELSVAEEHMASEITTTVMARHAPFGGAGDGWRSAVVACPGAETHVLGARAVAGALSERGWSVIFLGAATPPASLAALVAARRPTLVALSTKLPAHLEATREAIERIKALDHAPVILVGGDAFAGRPLDLGADLVYTGLEAALAATGWLGGERIAHQAGSVSDL